MLINFRLRFVSFMMFGATLTSIAVRKFSEITEAKEHTLYHDSEAKEYADAKDSEANERKSCGSMLTIIFGPIWYL